MATTSAEYWKNREAEQLKHNIADEKEYTEQLEKIYRSMISEIEKQINGFYGKYATTEGITISEAKKRAETLEIEAYSEKAAKYVAEKDFSDQANAEMRLYNMTMKANRLELLKSQIGLELVSGFNEVEQIFDGALNDRAIAEYERLAGILGGSVSNSEKTANAIVNASFHNATYSDRIWMYQDMLKNELASLLQSGLIQGQNPRQLATHLRKRFGVSQYNAERLMRTELARVQIEAQKQALLAGGFKYYTFLALEMACKDCLALDGKHFELEKLQPGVNAAPLHPSCRCSISGYENSASYEDWIDELDSGKDVSWKDFKNSENSDTNDSNSGIMTLPRYEEAVIPERKFTQYALNPQKDYNKVAAFEKALGYTLENADDLIKQIRDNLPKYEAKEKGDSGYGMAYEVIMNIAGPNGKTAKVLTGWIDDKDAGEMRLTTVHIDD